MKILYIAHESGRDFNGASRSLLNIIDGMIKLDHRVYVLIPKNDGKMYEELKKRNCTIYHSNFYRWSVRKSRWLLKNLYLLMRYNIYERQYNMIIAKHISKYVLEEGIDLIHSNSGVINIGGYISKFSGVKHIWHFREFGEEDFNMVPLISKKKYYRFIDNNSTICVAISKAIYKKYSEFLSDGKVKVIYNGVTPNNLVEKKQDILLQRKSNKFNMLISGRICKEKGQKVAIEALNVLLEKGYNVDLYIAGDGDHSCLGTLNSTLKKHIVFLGNTDSLDKVRLNMDIELMCSKSEAFGRVTVEAMLMELPVIGSASGGTKELIIDGYNGYLFLVNDSYKLSQKIELLINDRKLCREIGKNAFEFANSKFTQDILIKNIDNLYKNICI